MQEVDGWIHHRVTLFFPQAFLKIVFVKVLQQLRAYKLLYNFCHIQPFFLSFFFFSDWNPKCSNLMLFDCKELLMNMKSQFTKPPLMTDNLVEPTKHLNGIMLTYCSSKWAGPMECPPILISFYVNVERSNVVGFMSSC